MIIIISGVLRALAMVALYVVYQWLLTKPLAKIIEHQASTPTAPANQLPMLKGNEKNELGLWIHRQPVAGLDRAHTTPAPRSGEQPQRMSHTIFLTGLPNRQQLQEQLDQILSDAGGFSTAWPYSRRPG